MTLASFMAKVNQDGPCLRPELGPCWEWRGYRQRAGYGIARFDRKNHKAHRVSWELANGPIPRGLFVLHRCDNRACTRPSHLFLGTHADNAADRVAKGRSACTMGAANPRAVLSEAQWRGLGRLREQGLSDRRIAQMFGVHPTTIHRARTGRTWRQQ